MIILLIIPDILIDLPHEVILLHCTFSQSMKWTEEHELVMLRELMLLQPWLYKKGTSERGNDWEKLAVSLNAIPYPQFRVTQRPVHDHYSTMEKRRRDKVREEDRASEIAPEEDKELDQLLDETIELFDESDKITDKKRNRTRKNKQRKQRKCKRDHWKLLKIVLKGMAMNSKEHDRKRVELVVQTLWLT